MNGKQQKIINSNGRGPLEFITPSIVKYYNDEIYVWCSSQLKLIVFDINGKPIREYINFERAIRDFLIYDNYAVLYQSGGITGNFISIYDLKKELIIHNYGNTSQEHLLLSTRPDAGGMTIIENKLLYTTTDELGVYSIDLETFKEIKLLSFEDQEFKTEKLKTSARNLINNNKSEMMNYLNENSYVSGMYNLNNNIVIKAEVGTYIIDGTIFDYSQRYNKLHFVNLKKEEIEVYKYDLTFPVNGLFTIHDDKFYFIELIREDENFYYQLNSMF